VNVKDFLKGKIPDSELELVNRSYDVVGDIAVVSVPDELTGREKLIAKAVMSINKHVSTVVKRVGVTEGVHRVRSVEHVLGEKKTVTIHVENGCRFLVDLDKVYFNPRLGSERLRVVNQFKKDDVVLDLFAGVGPFSIPAAKKCEKVFAVDINPSAMDLLRKNAELNKVRVEAVQGDLKTVWRKLPQGDRIVMNLPKNSIEFLPIAVKLCGRGGRIYLYTDEEVVEAPKGFKHVFSRKVLMIGPRVWHFVHEFVRKKWWFF